MKTIIRLLCLALACFALTMPLNAQSSRPMPTTTPTLAKNKLPKADYYLADGIFELTTESSSYTQIVSKANYLTLKADKLAALMAAKPRRVVLTIPTTDGDVRVELEQAQMFTEDFEARDGSTNLTVDWKPGLYYRGQVIDREGKLGGSMAAISFFNDEVFGVLSYGGTNHVIGYLGDRTQGTTEDYVYYADNNLLVGNTIECHTNTEDIVVDELPSSMDKSVSRKQFNEYLVGDNNLYLDFGSNYTATLNHMSGIYNIVAYIYERDDIGTLIEYMYLFSSADPFTDTNTDTQLSTFDAWLDPFSPGVISLAHLMSGANAGGGLAWIDVLCSGDDLAGRSGVSNIYSTYNQFPTYSWSVMVVTHEIGHNLGSGHTHDCAWNGNNTRIDNCGGNAGYPSGTCVSNPPNPVTGGTIMSYCHLQSVGINLWNGFGIQPRDRIQAELAGATCLVTQYANCDAETNIGCGQTISSTTVGYTNYATTYYFYTSEADGITGTPVGWTESGPERAYLVQLDAPSTISATLSGLSVDLDVLIMGTCNEYTVLAKGDYTATTGVLPAGTYWIIVEGFNGVSGTFNLTVDCGGCASYGNPVDEHISNAIIGNINNSSGNNGGYGNYDYLTLNTGIQDSVSVSLTPGYTGSAYTEYFRVYIDYNKDGDYYDNNEMVFEGNGTTTVNGWFQIPIYDADGNTAAGATTMRVVMKWGSYGDPCGQNSFGETEDYAVNIAGTCPTDPNTVDEWIESFAVDAQTFPTGNNGGYYEHSSSINVIAGLATPVVLTPGYTSTNYAEYWKWYGDMNANGYFEQTLLSTPNAAGAQAATLTLPSYTYGGSYRTRLVMSYGTSYDPCKDGSYGETEEIYMNVCGTYAGNDTYEYIDSVRFATMGYKSGANEGYLYTGQTFSSIQGGTVAFFGRPGYASTVYTENWGVWVDWNGDGAYVASEKMVNKSGNTDVNGVFVVPYTTAPGTYGVRVMMKYGTAPANGCSVSNYDGEMEDYTLNVVGGACANTVTAPAVVRLSPTSVALTWNRVPGASFYRFTYRATGTLTWSALQTSATNSVVLTGLAENTTYEFRIQVKCPLAYTAYNPAPYFSFATVTSVGVCARPLVLSNSPASYATQNLYWNYTPSALKYRVRYRETYLTPITYVLKTLTAPVTNTSIPNLKAGTSYSWQVQTLCPPGAAANYTSYSPINTFVTLGNGTALTAANDTENLDGDMFPGVKLAPNPASDEFTILIEQDLEIKGINIQNLNGQVIMDMNSMPFENKINVSTLSGGVYMVIMTTTDGQQIVKRLIKI
jgi:Metallo-peptidase family M12/GEVED domain/Secretion system C-terminal sorting domain/Fibronectin type III domain